MNRFVYISRNMIRTKQQKILFASAGFPVFWSVNRILKFMFLKTQGNSRTAPVACGPGEICTSFKKCCSVASI